ncbi:hypothetical protein [Spiribacter vilamensis]|uniref:Oligosaccharide biosynthesis protein Alg14 n=1 Tax=Spiribacter vilamensis TaxID=531306 RepID=A0A4Q8CZK9_9GAMM|nr:hypothetical protein [Spiribacter vilamensis]RZU98360.1 oligosaccharide biosynthesis protein Alg14 [Spiribacter vilamensis]
MQESERQSAINARPRVLLIASGGGHWTQLLRLRPAWVRCDVAYATTDAGYRPDVIRADDIDPPRFYVIPPANMHHKLRLAWQFLAVVRLIVRERPDAVVTTGASAGYFALRLGRILGSRTVWVDSIANAAELSLAGRRIGPYADLWLTQWPELAGEPGAGDRPVFRGAVI